ncbi:MAG TPA: thiamine pyrophosphate-binding protein [Candidatus Binatia bacterium]|nr:thiamine pyrophosphate-binding protein [Candidatus Binatia bacterium]
MRDLVDRYLGKRLSRRGFMRGLARFGFSVAAVGSILESLDPLIAEAADQPAGRIVTGTGAELLVEQLRAAGVRFVFNCNSSGTYPIFDALVDRPDMHVIQVLHEGLMIAIAQGHALASGTCGFTVNGSVGLPNTLSNMYNAWKDRTPIVSASQREASTVHGGRDAFEEWDDYLSPSASFTRWRWSVDRAERIPEIVRRAFKIASTPPEGPVTLAFPRDVLAAAPVQAAIVERERFLIPPRVKPSPDLVADAARLLLHARRPVVLLGPEVTRTGATAAVVALAEQLALPVVQAERLFDDFPTRHPLFIGDLRTPLAHPVDPDLLLCLGARIPAEDGSVPAGAKVVHVSIDPDVIGRIAATDVGIVADVKEAASDLAAAVESLATKPRLESIRSARLPLTQAYGDRLRSEQRGDAQARWHDRPLSWERIGGELERLLELDAIVVPELSETSWVGAQENAALGQLGFAPGGKRRIGRTTGSALGWGVGAAIGVKLAQPDRQVVALQGDGGFLFGQAEALWTMARHEVPVIVVVFNNRSYNGPRNKIMNETGRQATARKDMTCYLGDPDVDFARVAAGFGVAGEVVTAPEDIAPAIERAIASTRDGRPYLIDAIVGRTGAAAQSTWYPKFSVAAQRGRRV